MKQTKIAIIGAGSVGSTIAYSLMLRNIAAEISLIDVDEMRCRGEILDLSDVLSFSGSSSIQAGTSEKVKEADIIIIAAGARQKPGENRLSLLAKNKKIISSIAQSIKPLNPKSIVIVVTNPVDAITFYAQQQLNLPHSRVFGSGTFLDTQRLRNLLSKRLHIAEQSIHAYILGEHGDSQFAVWSCARVAGMPLSQLGLNEKSLDRIDKETRNKAYEIISCKGSTYYGIASCVTALCRTIIFNQKRVTPVSCYLEKENLYISLPAILGIDGIERILNLPLNEKEQRQLEQSIAAVKKLID